MALTAPYNIPTSWLCLVARIKYSIGLFVRRDGEPDNVSHFFRVERITPCRKLLTSCPLSFTSLNSLICTLNTLAREKSGQKGWNIIIRPSQNVPIKTWTRKAGFNFGENKSWFVSPNSWTPQQHLDPSSSLQYLFASELETLFFEALLNIRPFQSAGKSRQAGKW